jgi:hypothetical protein
LEPNTSPIVAAVVNWRDWSRLLVQHSDLLIVIGLVVGFTLTLIYLHKLLKALQPEKEAPRTEFERLTANLTEVNTTLSAIHKRLDEGLSDLREAINEHSGERQSDSKTGSNETKSMSVEAPISTPEKDSATDPVLSEFPSSLADYLHHLVKTNQSRMAARSDALHDGNLIFSPEGEFVIVSNELTNEHLVVPQVTRFSSGEDFSGYFGDFFDCDAPAAGEVWITRPAFVQSDEIKGGWRVVKKGQLEVRQ